MRIVLFIILLVPAVLVAKDKKMIKGHKLIITPLVNDFYVYTTYRPVNGSPFPSNSMYLVTSSGIVLFDTPWDTTQFQPLLDSLQRRHHKKVILCIATHFHDDRTAGLTFFRTHGIPTYSSKLTYDLCKERGEHQAEFYFIADTTFTIGEHRFNTFYPGPGHSQDNIVIWFEKEKILYGGCLVKSIENQSLGYIADANIKLWGAAIQLLLSTFPDPMYIVPGHFGWQSNKTLLHTLGLIKDFQ